MPAVDGVELVIHGEIAEAQALEILEEEKARFAARGKKLARVELTADGDEIIVRATELSPIRRVRRITGYLAPTDNWNAAKQAELRDRVVQANLTAVLGKNEVKSLGVKLRVNGLFYESVVDGPGIRDALFVQGCPRRCPGCHNPGSWDFGGGTEVDVAEVVAALPSSPLVYGVTFSGGEPFCQAEALLPIARHVKRLDLSLWIYTGYTWEELLAHPDPAVWGLLTLADVVVDGPFVRELADMNLAFRGSANQRLIDVPASLEKGEVVLWEPRREELPPPVKMEKDILFPRGGFSK
jgi:anaerobic ribonucleoside-triphosphate reductase activating protein